MNVNFYTWPNPAFPFWLYLNHRKARIFIIENIFHNYYWLDTIKDNIKDTDIFISLTGWYIDDYIAKQSAICLEMLGISKEQFIILYNCEQEQITSGKYGFTGHVINHNTWLDHKKFKVNTHINKKYDALYIARPTRWKNHHLLTNTKNLALVAGGPNHGNDSVQLPKCLNDPHVRLDREEVVEIINQSRCGLCLSEHEGACYTSSEYLLCGLPVVSVESVGGRDYWYNDHNSIICAATETSINTAITRTIDMRWDPMHIRESHVEQMLRSRSEFVTILQNILHKYNIQDIDAKTYYEQNFREKMKMSSKIEDVCEIFKKKND